MKHFLRAAGAAALAGIAGFLMSGTSASAASGIVVGSVPAFFSGTYGTGKTIDIFYVPNYVEYRNDRLRIKLTVPYEHASGLPQGASLSGSNIVSRGGNTQTHSASGLGDTWLEAHYSLTRSNGLVPGFHPYAKIKFATASHSSGLGSGKNDYEVGFGLDNRVGKYVFPFMHVGYRVVGKPAGLNLQNIATYDAGASYVLPQSHADILTGMFTGSQSTEKGFAGPADIIFAWNHNVTQQGSGFQLYIDKGLTNGSANYGVGLGGQFVF